MGCGKDSLVVPWLISTYYGGVTVGFGRAVLHLRRAMFDGSALSHSQVLTPDPGKTLVTHGLKAGSGMSTTVAHLQALAAAYSLTVFFSSLPCLPQLLQSQDVKEDAVLCCSMEVSSWLKWPNVQTHVPSGLTVEGNQSR